MLLLTDFLRIYATPLANVLNVKTLNKIVSKQNIHNKDVHLWAGFTQDLSKIGRYNHLKARWKVKLMRSISIQRHGYLYIYKPRTSKPLSTMVRGGGLTNAMS